MPTEFVGNTDYDLATSGRSTGSPWNTAYTYTTPGYANYAAARGGGAPLSAAGSVPYGNVAMTLNALMTQQAKNALESNLPNYSQMVAQRSQNLGSELRGEVPEDEQRNLINAAAARGVAIGSPGSPNANASWLQALGLTSRGIKEQGSAGLSRAIADTPTSPLWNPSSLFVPEHLAGLELGAANAGLMAGRGFGGGGGGMLAGPNISSGISPSWSGAPGQISAGAVGPFDVYNPPSTTGGFYNLPTGNTYGGGGSSNFDPYFQPGDGGSERTYSVGDDWWDMFEDL